MPAHSPNVGTKVVANLPQTVVAVLAPSIEEQNHGKFAIRFAYLWHKDDIVKRTAAAISIGFCEEAATFHVRIAIAATLGGEQQ
ncbi:MAG: hypothetical protein AABP62_21985 [Planctomycetota bacterium]